MNKQSTLYKQAKEKYKDMFLKLYKSDGIITVNVNDFPKGVYNICKAVQSGRINNEALVYAIKYFEETNKCLLHLMPMTEDTKTEVQFERYIPISRKLIKNYNKYKNVDKFELIKILSEEKRVE